MGTEFHFEEMKKFWRWVMVMVAHYVNGLNAAEPYTLKMAKQ